MKVLLFLRQRAIMANDGNGRCASSLSQDGTLPTSLHFCRAGMGSHLLWFCLMDMFHPQDHIPSDQVVAQMNWTISMLISLGCSPPPLQSPRLFSAPLPRPPGCALLITGRRECYWLEKRGCLPEGLKNITEISQSLRNSQHITIQNPKPFDWALFMSAIWPETFNVLFSLPTNEKWANKFVNSLIAFWSCEFTEVGRFLQKFLTKKDKKCSVGKFLITFLCSLLPFIPPVISSS